MSKCRVAIVGSGSWGTCAAKICAENIAKSAVFEPEVSMWTFEETLADGRLLSVVINSEHENVKYLPGVKLPANVKAIPSIEDACRNATHLVFVVPHQVRKKACVFLGLFFFPPFFFLLHSSWGGL
jgi:glycerol-3-phosphate dehydrogenase (NAD+)